MDTCQNLPLFEQNITFFFLFSSYSPHVQVCRLSFLFSNFHTPKHPCKRRGYRCYGASYVKQEKFYQRFYKIIFDAVLIKHFLSSLNSFSSYLQSFTRFICLILAVYRERLSSFLVALLQYG